MSMATKKLKVRDYREKRNGLVEAMCNAHGLVVGIANYTHLNQLPNIVLKDAMDIHQLLIDPNYCAYSKTNVELLLDEQATQPALQEALTRLARRCDEESTVFFYISSHGCSIESGRFAGEYILTVDTREDTGDDPDQSLALSAISGNQFSEMLHSIPARKLVAVLDCCHAGGIGEPKSRSRRKVNAIPESYYQTLARGCGRVILASSRSNEVSYVLPGSANSLFTQHLLSGLRGGVPGPGQVIRIFDLFNHLQPRVTKDCAQQHPILKAEVEENFPVALYLGGKGMTAERPVTNQPAQREAPLEGSAWVMHKLQLLLGSDDRLSERDQTILCSALRLELSGTSGRALPPEAAEWGDEVKQVVARARQTSKPVVLPTGHPSTELLSALLRIGLRINLCRQGLAKNLAANPASWSVEHWLAYLTEDIVCDRGVLCFRLVVPDGSWVMALIGATALAMENLWQQVRSVLTQNGFSFAVARSQFAVDASLHSIPAGVLKRISKTAEEAKKSWPEFPHLGERTELPDLAELLPLPQSNIHHSVVFKGRNGCPIRLRVGNDIVAECDQENAEIEYWPQVEGPVECVLECDEGGDDFVPLVHSRLQRLYAMEAEIFNAAPDELEACVQLGLKNELLRIMWPKIITRSASLAETSQVLHLLRDAWEAYEVLSLKHSSLFGRRDIYWDAMELTRKLMQKETKI